MTVALPVRPSPNSMEVMPLDKGFFQRGASSLRVDKPGNRYSIGFTFPIMHVDDARRFVAKLQRAKRQGLRIDIPMLVKQGIPGSPVVDGVNDGTTLNVRGFAAGYAVREGFWFTIVEAATDNAYLHSVYETTVADATGVATLQIEPPLRAPFADGDVIEFAKPYVVGFMEDFSWPVRSDRYVELSIAVEEFE